jgi:hypothetical protein
VRHTNQDLEYSLMIWYVTLKGKSSVQTPSCFLQAYLPPQDSCRTTATTLTARLRMKSCIKGCAGDGLEHECSIKGVLDAGDCGECGWFGELCGWGV